MVKYKMIFTYFSRNYFEQDVILMNESKFAKLDPEQIQELQQLEEKLEVTLLAYDQSINESFNQQNKSVESID